MEKTRKVIPQKYLAVKLPIHKTALQVFLLYYFKAPDWVWGVYTTLALIVWIALIVALAIQKQDKNLINL